MILRTSLIVLALLLSGTAAAQEAPAALSDASLGEHRGGIATPLGFDIGFGASVRTYVDGALALETRLTWTAEGARTARVFESEAAKTLTGEAARATNGAVVVAPGATVIHDLTENRIASIVLNTGNDRSIRQDTDVSLHLPQLPDLQQQIAAQRMAQALQALSPQAAGLRR